MIQEIREKYLQLNNNDEFFYLIFAINQISGLFVNKNSLYYAIKNRDLNEEWLSKLEWRDDIFPEMDFRIYN